MALFSLPLLLLLLAHLATPASSTRCISAILEARPRASVAEIAGSDSGMPRAAPQQPERSTTADDPSAAGLHALHHVSAARLLADLPPFARWPEASVVFHQASKVRIQPVAIRFCLRSRRGGQFVIVRLDRFCLRSQRGRAFVIVRLDRFCLRSQRGGPFVIARLLDRHYCAPVCFSNMAVLVLDNEAIIVCRGAFLIACLLDAPVWFSNMARPFVTVRLLDRHYCAREVFDNEPIIVGGGGPVPRGGQALRFVPGHRLSASGVPSLADEGRVVMNHGSALDELAKSVDAIHAHFPHLHAWVDGIDGGANADDDGTDWAPTTFWAIGLIPAILILIPLRSYFFGRRTMSAYQLEEINGEMRLCHVCDNCWVRAVNWVTSCCGLCLCLECFAFVYLRRHSSDISDRPCENPGAVGVFNEGRPVVFETNRYYYQSSNIEMEVEQIPYKSPDSAAKLQLRVFTSWRDLYARCRPARTLKIKITEHNGKLREWRKIDLVPKKYTSGKVPLVMRWIGWE